MASINLDSAKVLAKARFAEVFPRSQLSNSESSKLTVGCMPGASTITCTFYVPGEKPQDARILAIITVDRRTGETELVDSHA
ncbi:MAG: hypothetical protein Fues2KO_44120 [Fuerstiella sp.]